MSMIGYNPALMKQLAGTKKKPGSLTNPAGTPYVVGSANGKMPQSTSPLDPEQAAATAEKPAPAASPLVPGVPVAGPGVMTPAQVNSTLPAPQRIADLQAKESTYRQAIVNPSISPAERMMAKEKVAALAAERRALENSNANGPKFLDATAAANSTQKLLEQTLTQMRDQIGRPEVDQSSLEKRFNDTAAELEKVKSGAYAAEYNSPERVAAREAAMQKHLARQKAYADEANRLADTRMQGEAEVAKQRELKDAAMQAQLAGIQQGTQAGDLGNQMTQAQIEARRAQTATLGPTADMQRRKAEMDLRLGEQKLKTGDLDLNDKQALGDDRVKLLRQRLAQETKNVDNAGYAIQNQADMAKINAGYAKAGYSDRTSLLNAAQNDWMKTVAPQLDTWSGTKHVVSGNSLTMEADPTAADKFEAHVVAPIESIAMESPQEAKLIAKNVLAQFPDKDFVGLGSESRRALAAKLNAIKARLSKLAGN